MGYFTWLYEYAFPLLGEVFGYISAFASVEVSQLYRFGKSLASSTGVLAMNVTNLFTGEVLLSTIEWSGISFWLDPTGLTNQVLGNIIALVFPNVAIPMWAWCVGGSFVIYLLIRVVRSIL